MRREKRRSENEFRWRMQQEDRLRQKRKRRQNSLPVVASDLIELNGDDLRRDPP
jgi:hypothetical protein